MSVQLDECPRTAWFSPTSAPVDEEAEWIARAAAGEEAGFRWLLDRYRERVVRLAAHVLRSAAEAEDVAQEAFIRAFRNIRSFRGDSRFYTWLYHIVVRACLDRRKSAWWRREVQTPPDAEERAPCDREGTEDRALVAALLDRLSPPMRAALVLRELEGLDYAEIAVALEIPVGTVRSRLNSARSQFRALWEAAQQEAQNV